MPWSPMRAFPHPLANIHDTSTDAKLANYLSYGLVQVLTWQGLSDVINDWRKTLGLEPVPLTEGPFLLETLKVPYTYCWSPSLVPKPTDWPAHIDVCGFMFRTPTAYNPSGELDAFLKAGPIPIYIGFGSIVVEDPDALLATILEAVQICGVRAIILKGWSNFASAKQPQNVLFLRDCPHDWLFQHVSAVVHHGGAGTTAAGLPCGKPTAIVPFIGDQPFWGEMVAAAGAGPAPIPYKKLTSSNLANAINTCFSPDAATAAQEIAKKMQEEDGVQAAVASFHNQLSSEGIRCDLVPTLPAVYRYSKKKAIKMCGSAADTLIKHGRIEQSHLTLYEPKPIRIENRRWDSVTAGAAVGVGVAYDILSATNDLWYAPHKLRKTTQATIDDPAEGSNTGSKLLSGTQHAKRTARMVGASAMTIPKLYKIMLKGFIVDTPLAITEGLRATPRLYGEEVKDHDPITGIGSGVKVAGKDLVTQFGLGMADLAVQPYKGARDEGPSGFVKGIGRGVLGTFLKGGAGLAGLVAYPTQGIYKSLHAMTHSDTKKRMLSARRVHDIYFARTELGKVDEQQVLDAFDALKTLERTLSRPLPHQSSGD